MCLPSKPPLAQRTLIRFQFEVHSGDVTFEVAGEELVAVGAGSVCVPEFDSTW